MNGTMQYTIRPHDTIFMLARLFNTTVESILQLNPGIQPENLQVGHVITIAPGFPYNPYGINQPGNRGIIGQPMGQPIGQPMGQPMSQPMGQPKEQPMGRPMGQPKEQPMGQPMGRPMGQPMEQTTGTAINNGYNNMNGMNNAYTYGNPMNNGYINEIPMNYGYPSGNPMSNDYNYRNQMGIGCPAQCMMNGNVVSRNEMDLVNYMRMLWEQHVTWTRMAILAILYDLPGSDMIQERLMRNPNDFAGVLSSFYGEKAGKDFADLLAEHLTIAGELVKDAKEGNMDAYDEAEKRWYANAEQIAALLASLNAYWNEEDWDAMLQEHLNLLSTNVANLIAENYEQSVMGYDDIELQALEMADMMAEGIDMQFPG
jgi:hypothetical protein